MSIQNENYFGGSAKKNVKCNQKLLEVEQKKEALFVVLSDVWLDKEEVRRGEKEGGVASILYCYNSVNSSPH